MALNRKHTEEEIRKISEAMKGKVKTPEVRAKISATMKQWAANNPTIIQERVNRLTIYRQEADELEKPQLFDPRGQSFIDPLRQNIIDPF